MNLNHTKIFSFHSHKGGSGRTFAMVNTAEALAIQGQNVLLVDFDIEAAGLPAFSQLPSPLFSPENIFFIDVKNGKLSPIINESNKEEKIIDLPGLLSCFITSDGKVSQEAIIKATTDSYDFAKISKIIKNVPVYEARTYQQHPMEGRLFILPLGGYFTKKTNKDDIDKLTPWAFCPPTGVEEEVIHKNYIHTFIDDIDMKTVRYGHYKSASFIQELISSAKSQINKVCKSKLNYALLDHRPGQIQTSININRDIHGVVLVGLPSNSNLTGLRSLALRSMKKKAPPIAGLLMNIIPARSTGGDDGWANYSRVITDNVYRASWDEIWEIHDNEKSTSNLVCPNKSLPSYFFNQRANYHIEIVHNEITELSINKYWDSLFNKDKNREKFTKYFLKSDYNEELRVYDKLVNNRSFIWKTLSDDFKDKTENIDGILSHESVFCVLAAHLRQFSQTYQINDNSETITLQADDDFKARESWLNSQNPDSFNKFDSVFSLFYQARAALGCSDFDAAVKYLDEYDIKLNHQISNLPQRYQYKWRGDWRSSFLRIEATKKNEIEYENNIEETLARFNWLIETAKNKDTNWLEGDDSWEIDKHFFTKIKLKLLIDFAELKIKKHDFELALKKIKEAYKVSSNQSTLVVIVGLHYKCAKGLISLNKVKQGQEELLHLSERQLVDYHKEKTTGERRMLSNLSIRIKLENYWNNYNDDIAILESILISFKEWENVNGKGESKDDALTYFYYGMAVLDLALLKDTKSLLNKRADVRYSLERFEKCILIDEKWPIGHFSLAIARVLQYYLIEYENKSVSSVNYDYKDRTPEEKDKTKREERYSKQLFKTEQSARLRDAFYAFEQTFAFYQDDKSVNFFFNDEDASNLADLLEETLMWLKREYGILHEYSTRFDKCLSLKDWIPKYKDNTIDDRKKVANILSKIVYKEVQNNG